MVVVVVAITTRIFGDRGANNCTKINMTMTYLTTTSTFLVAAITLLTTVPFLSVAAEQGFGAAGTLNLDLKLTGNTSKNSHTW